MTCSPPPLTSAANNIYSMSWQSGSCFPDRQLKQRPRGCMAVLPKVTPELFVIAKEPSRVHVSGVPPWCQPPWIWLVLCVGLPHSRQPWCPVSVYTMATLLALPFTGPGSLTAFNQQPFRDPSVKLVIQLLYKMIVISYSWAAETSGCWNHRGYRLLTLELQFNGSKEEDGRPVSLHQPQTGLGYSMYPLPTVEELSASLVFSKFKMGQGYLKATQHADSCNLAVLLTHMWEFWYSCVPFGLSKTWPPSLWAFWRWLFTWMSWWHTEQCPACWCPFFTC